MVWQHPRVKHVRVGDDYPASLAYLPSACFVVYRHRNCGLQRAENRFQSEKSYQPIGRAPKPSLETSKEHVSLGVSSGATDGHGITQRFPRGCCRRNNHVFPLRYSRDRVHLMGIKPRTARCCKQSTSTDGSTLGKTEPEARREGGFVPMPPPET